MLRCQCHTPGQHGSGDTQLLTPACHAADGLAAQALGIKGTLAGDHQVAAHCAAVEVHGVQHRRDTGAQGTAQQRSAARAEAAGGTAAGEGGHLRVQLFMQHRGEMPKSRVQTLHEGIVRPLLRSEDVRRAGFAVQGVVDVAHDRQHTGPQAGMPPGQVDSLDVRQRAAGGHEAAALPVVKPNAKRRGRTAAAVVGAAAAQTQDQALCAVIQRVGQKLSHTVGGGRLRVGTALGLGQARCGGATAVPSGSRP